MHDSVQIAERLNDERLEQYPEHAFFLFGRKEIESIRRELGDRSEVEAGVYGAIKVGLMCVKELEHCDMEYCDAIYRMLEDIRPKQDGHK